MVSIAKSFLGIKAGVIKYFLSENRGYSYDRGLPLNTDTFVKECITFLSIVYMKNIQEGLVQNSAFKGFVICLQHEMQVNVFKTSHM
ncbi:hypothetical protein GCM10007932_57850 [Vibrio penaeicida]|uniref:Uncharacterized protein n=1 Tax=Vibrio penaeicida TaxID=104609 RepID=A0AAV5P1V1_9VIBR|nr:hypothetical protein GCM10007932_57850 [Vibrio penaeicida]